MGLIMLAVIVITIRSELSFLSESKTQKLQLVLSVLSLVVLTYLTLTWLLHWNLPPVYVVTTTMLLVPILLVLAPIILWLRSRSFRKLASERRQEQEKLIREVQELLDEKKREKIRQGKVKRGEKFDN